MARFPVIDNPCPLSHDEIAAIEGDCARCGKPVHALDGVNDSVLLKNAKGSICVSYRLSIGIAAALALSLAAPAIAEDSVPPCDTGRKAATQEIVVGTVRDAANARWIEDTTLPELPTAPDD